MATAIPHKNDVLSGRGSVIDYHHGNQQFRSMVDAQRPKFAQTDKKEKRAFALKIMQDISSLEPPGRFLTESKGVAPSTNSKNDPIKSEGVDHLILSKVWVIMDHEKTIQKVRHRLREKGHPDSGAKHGSQPSNEKKVKKGTSSPDAKVSDKLSQNEGAEGALVGRVLPQTKAQDISQSYGRVNEVSSKDATWVDVKGNGITRPSIHYDQDAGRISFNNLQDEFDLDQLLDEDENIFDDDDDRQEQAKPRLRQTNTKTLLSSFCSNGSLDAPFSIIFDKDDQDHGASPKSGVIGHQSEDSMTDDDSFSKLFGDESDGCQQPSNTCETKPSKGVGPALLTEGQRLAESCILPVASDWFMKKGDSTWDSTKSQTATSTEFLCAPWPTQMPGGEVQVTSDKGAGSSDQQQVSVSTSPPPLRQASFGSVSISPPTLASEAQQARRREDHPAPVDKSLRMSFVSIDDESDTHRSCNASPNSEQDYGRRHKLETVSETTAAPKGVGGSKVNRKTVRSKKLPTYTQVFSDILQGFLKGDHYIEDDDAGTTVSDTTSLQSISPVPLAPHVELRHTAQIIGMGFFSQLQEGGQFDSVVGTTEKKKRNKVSRKRKPKTDLLEGTSRRISSQMGAEQQQQQQQVEDNNNKAIKPQEISERIKPAYSWAPTVDERTRTVMEFSLPLVLPAVAMLSNFTSFARIYCFALPFVHTLETLLTNFGPKASNLHFKFAPINPMSHMCIDLMLLHPMCILAFVCPEEYGPNAHVYGGILFFLEYIYWAVAYKDVVARREEAARAKIKSI